MKSEKPPKIHRGSNGDNNLVARQGITDEALKRFISTLPPRVDHFPREVQELLNYVHTHLFEEQLSVEEARAAGRLTNRNVVTRFRQLVGMSPRKYITDLRLQAAAFALERTDSRVCDLALAVGYSEETFCKLFKKFYGCTPLQYRKMQIQKNGQEI